MRTFIWRDGLQRDVLPIDHRLTDIVDATQTYQTIIVAAETGSGKSTHIAQALEQEIGCRVWQAMPRRTTVRWTGKRIASELGCRPGELVGWHLAGEESFGSDQTRIQLMTHQSYVNSVCRHDGRLPAGKTILDDGHGRSVSVDLTFGLTRAGLKDPKKGLIITSATLDLPKIQEYFNGAPVIRVEGRCFPVSTEVIRLLHGEHHTQGASRAAGMVMRRWRDGRLEIPTNDDQGTRTVSSGTVLILLPGKEDIQSVMEDLKALSRELDIEQRVQVLMCHGESTTDEQDAIQSPLDDGILRFVCGTEVLRDSVTVRYTIGAIDSLQIKRNLADSRGVVHTEKIAVSRAQADQAKGRPGRNGPGFYMPISFGSEYEQLKPHALPAILSEPLTGAALQLALLERSIRTFPFMDVPEPARVDVAIRRLRDVGGLDAEERITDTGKELLRFSIDPERAASLLIAGKLGVLPEIMIVLAAGEAEGIFHAPARHQPTSGRTELVTVDEDLVRLLIAYNDAEWPREGMVSSFEGSLLDRQERWIQSDGYGGYAVDCSSFFSPLRRRGGAKCVADILRKVWAGESRSDFVAVVRAFRAFKNEERRLREVRVDSDVGEQRELSWREREKKLREWCRRHFLNYKRLRMAEDIVYQLRDEIRDRSRTSLGSLMDLRDFDANALTKALIAGHVDQIAACSNGDCEGPLGRFSLSFSSACPRGSELVLISRLTQVAAKRGHKVFLAELAAPVMLEWLEEVMPHLCRTERIGEAYYDEDEDAVLERQALHFRDFVLAEREVKATDAESASMILARWLAERMV